MPHFWPAAPVLVQRWSAAAVQPAVDKRFTMSFFLLPSASYAREQGKRSEKVSVFVDEWCWPFSTHLCSTRENLTPEASCILGLSPSSYEFSVSHARDSKSLYCYITYHLWFHTSQVMTLPPEKIWGKRGKKKRSLIAFCTSPPPLFPRIATRFFLKICFID